MNINQQLADQVKASYTSRFGDEPQVVFSPGRINLIGEHTDYNNGFVLPAAINLGTYLVIGPSETNSTLVALGPQEEYSFRMSEEIKPVDDGGWRNYVLGVIHKIKEIRDMGEINVVFDGDIPIGSGLSSSASLENAMGVGLNELFNLEISKEKLLRISQWSEHNFVGVKCGIMDQFASMMGVVDHAILLDCEDLDSKTIPVDLGDHEIVLVNSNVKHNLASSEYNVRRQQCEDGLQILRANHPELDTLRDATLEMIDTHESDLGDLLYKRCRYVVEENERVLEFAKALEAKDLNEIGELLYAGHEGLRYQYEVSCEEIDYIVDFTKEHSDILGARMMGGGFGGCVLMIAEKGAIDRLFPTLHEKYGEKFGLGVTLIRVELNDGAKMI